MKNLNIAFIIATLSLSSFSMAEESTVTDLIERKKIDERILDRLREDIKSGESIRTFDRKSYSRLPSMSDTFKVLMGLHSKAEEKSAYYSNGLIRGTSKVDGQEIDSSLYAINDFSKPDSADGKSDPTARHTISDPSDPQKIKFTVIGGLVYKGNVILNKDGVVEQVNGDKSKEPLLLYTIKGDKVYLGAITEKNGKIYSAAGAVTTEIGSIDEHLTETEKASPMESSSKQILALTRAGFLNSKSLLTVGALLRDLEIAQGKNFKINDDILKPYLNEYGEDLRDFHSYENLKSLKKHFKNIPRSSQGNTKSYEDLIREEYEAQMRESKDNE